MMENFVDCAAKYAAEGWLISRDELTYGKKLGDGASGVTYAGQYKGKQVAIKSYSPAMLSKDHLSVKNEMDIMARLKHQNVVGLVGMCLECETGKEYAALVMELAPKGELGHALYNGRVIKKKGDAVKFKIAIGLARGLEYLHGMNIIHRDVKTANILLDDEYGAMLTDFGFSRFIAASGDMTGETGSYRTMAPEVISHRKYSASADTYSWAIIVNELFTDEKPYEFLIPIEAAVGVAKRGLRPSQKKIKSERLRCIIARSWEQDPSKRPGWPEIIAELELSQTEMASGASRKGSLSAFSRPSLSGDVSSDIGATLPPARGGLVQKTSGDRQPASPQTGGAAGNGASKPGIGALFRRRIGGSMHGSGSAKGEDGKKAERRKKGHNLEMDMEHTT